MLTLNPADGNLSKASQQLTGLACLSDNCCASRDSASVSPPCRAILTCLVRREPNCSTLQLREPHGRQGPVTCLQGRHGCALISQLRCGGDTRACVCRRRMHRRQLGRSIYQRRRRRSRILWPSNTLSARRHTGRGHKDSTASHHGQADLQQLLEGLVGQRRLAAVALIQRRRIVQCVAHGAGDLPHSIVRQYVWS